MIPPAGPRRAQRGVFGKSGILGTFRRARAGGSARASELSPMSYVTFFPEPLVAVENPIWRPYAALAGLQAADVSLTAFVLAVGGAEQNPLARVLTDVGWPGLALLLIVKLSLVLLLFQRQTRVRLASALYTAVVVNNLLFAALYLWRT